MSADWINTSDDYDGGTDSEYTLKNNFVTVVARECNEFDEVKVGWMTVFTKGFHRHIEYSSNKTESLEAGEKWFTEQTTQAENAIIEKITSVKKVATEKNYKPGWVWYQIKDEFGADVANKYLPK